jgi:hypothetical protein
MAAKKILSSRHHCVLLKKLTLAKHCLRDDASVPSERLSQSEGFNVARARHLSFSSLALSFLQSSVVGNDEVFSVSMIIEMAIPFFDGEIMRPLPSVRAGVTSRQPPEELKKIILDSPKVFSS